MYGKATHYYDEEEIEVGKPSNCQVVVNHTVELTAEEKEQARQKAIQKVQDEAYTKMKQPIRKSAKPTEVKPQKSLFDL